MTQTAPASGLFGRAMRGSVITAGAYAFTQALRLGSNLVLTRLLVPEAFGLMALVSVVLVGLSMFSDMGVGPAISQHPLGDEPRFLNTAWTLNVLRGLMLWLLTCILALPAAHLYNAPDLALLLPAAGLTLLISGFDPTRIDTANRHLLLGRVTALDLISQVIGMAAIVLFAWAMRSVWALVLGAIVGTVAKLVLTSLFLPGERNRFAWEPQIGRDLIHFGKWIFLSTACGFLLSQGDKAILGAHLSLEQLGLYNIGFFLASFPVMLGASVTSRILIPLYRDHHPSTGAQNAARLRRMRYALSLGIIAMLAVIALLGLPLVRLLYDDRYLGAGAVVVAVALVQMPQVVGMTYDQAALAAGESRPYFLLMALRAAMQTAAFMIGASVGDLKGALLGQAIALYAVYPGVILLARRYGVQDATHDAICFALILAVTLFVLWADLPLLLSL